jgi:putative ABC transport system permease protein
MNDLRFAFRQLRKSPGFTAVAVLTLALGIGASTALFSVVHAVLIRPLPYPDPNRLLQVQCSLSAPGRPARTFAEWSYPRFESLCDMNRAFAQVAACGTRELTLTGVGEPERVKAEEVSASYFPLLGLRPVLGRVFTADEDRSAGAAAVAVLGDGFWRRRFGADPGVIGKTLRFPRATLTIIGVLPAGFRGQSGGADLWVPITLAPVLEGNPERLRRAGTMWHSVLARLQGGTSIATAQAEMAGLDRQLEKLHPGPDPGEQWSIQLVPLQRALTDLAIRRSLLVLLGAVGCVLLIACVNVANLLLARAAARRGEIAVRLALGATPARITRQMLVEGLLLSAAAGLLALLVARWGVDLLAAFQPADRPALFSPSARLPDFGQIRLSPVVLGFNFLVALGSAVLFSLLPAWQAARQPLSAPLHAASNRTAGRPPGRAALGGRNLLVAAETALALMLLVGAGLLVHSFTRLATTSLGFDPEHLLTARLDCPEGATEETAGLFFRQVLERVAVIPGVESACLANATPLSGTFDRSVAVVEGPGIAGGRIEVPIGVHISSTACLHTWRMPLLGGRWLTDQDQRGTKLVTVINQTFARKYWPGADPVGQSLDLSPALGPGYGKAEIVGVVGDVKYDEMDAAFVPDVYLSHLQTGYGGYYLTLRTTPDPSSLAGAVRRTVAALDASVPVYDVMTMRQRIANSLSRLEFNALLSLLFALLALGLAAIGLYGLVAYSVAQRTREIGIRLALGAEAQAVLRWMIWQGLRMVLWGGFAGLLGALALTRVLQGLLYGLTATDPLTFLLVLALLLAVAVLACWLPARRAAQVDPMVALRTE